MQYLFYMPIIMNCLPVPRFKAQDNNNNNNNYYYNRFKIGIDEHISLTSQSIYLPNHKNFFKFFLISLMKQKFILTHQYTILQETVETRYIFNCQTRKHIMFLRKY
jgi:hypothetical protein